MSAPVHGRGRLPALLALALAAAAAGSASAQPQPAEHPLLASAGRGLPALLGTVAEPRRIDAHGHAAVLVVERVLAGALAPGDRQPIAWEELSTSRPPRFAAGDRLLVVLEPLPGGSLWRARVPRGDALAVAAGGRAALEDPDATTVEVLARYVALSPEARAGAPGVSALLGLAAEAMAPIAEAALAELAGRDDLEVQLDEAARARYARLLADEARPAELRRAALRLAGAGRLTSLRPAIEPLASAGRPLEAAAREALIAIDGGLAPEAAAALLARDDPALRALALRSGGGAIDDARLAAAAGDPDADVRIAAADALLARRGEAALPTALPLLFDRDERVRRETARRISRLGAPAVPALRELLSERPYGEISELSPVALALALAGADGVAALEEIAAASPDPQRRKLADLALGRLGERH